MECARHPLLLEDGALPGLCLVVRLLVALGVHFVLDAARVVDHVFAPRYVEYNLRC